MIKTVETQVHFLRCRAGKDVVLARKSLLSHPNVIYLRVSLAGQNAAEKNEKRRCQWVVEKGAIDHILIKGCHVVESSALE